MTRGDKAQAKQNNKLGQIRRKSNNKLSVVQSGGLNNLNPMACYDETSDSNNGLVNGKNDLRIVVVSNNTGGNS